MLWTDTGATMPVMWAFVVRALPLFVAACFAPSPQPGSPCTGNDCPSPLVCSPASMTCEATAVDAAIADTSLLPGCTPTVELCGDAIDQDCDGSDLACVSNDRSAGAIDVTAGGTFTADLRRARDEVPPQGCGGDGGRDVFYRVTLAAPQVYYFDTFGSSVDTVVRVHAGPCGAALPAARACVNDACGGKQSQLALSLPAGTTCIVVDEGGAGEATGDLTLQVVKGGRDGLPLATGAQTYAGDTAQAANTTEPVDMNCDGPGADGRDHGYFFTTCPNQTLTLDAETCDGVTDFDSVLYVKRVNGMQLGCSDDACGDDARITNATISGSTLYWLYVDGYDAASSGRYQLTTNLR